MRSEIRSALVLGIIIAGAVGGIGVYFASLDAQIMEKSTISGNVLNTDKSQFKKAPELQGIAGYINTDSDLKEKIKGKVDGRMFQGGKAGYVDSELLCQAGQWVLPYAP